MGDSIDLGVGKTLEWHTANRMAIASCIEVSLGLKVPETSTLNVAFHFRQPNGAREENTYFVTVSITVSLASYLTSLDLIKQINWHKLNVSKATESKPVKQEVSQTDIPLTPYKVSEYSLV